MVGIEPTAFVPKTKMLPLHHILFLTIQRQVPLPLPCYDLAINKNIQMIKKK